MMSRRLHRRRGYVLVVTLGLLVLSATLLVSIGRAAVDHALRAKQAQAELQQRWGVISARRAIVTNAELTLSRLEQDLHRPLPVYRTSIRLGDIQFDLALSDEQAKANVNALLADAGEGNAETRVRAALSGSGLTNAVQFHLDPSIGDRSDGGPHALSGFGQIFDRVPPAQLLAEPAELLTCWGDGAINIMRASRESIALLAGGKMNELEIGRLIKQRDAAFAPLNVARKNLMPHANDQPSISNTSDPVVRLLARARIDPKVRRNVALISRSTCHSLWVVAKTPQSSRYFLFVVDESIRGNGQIQSFAW